MRKLFLVLMVGIFVFFHGHFAFADVNLTRVGQWGTGSYNDVSISGNYAYCAASAQGLDIIDISTRSNPVQMGNCNISGYARRVDVSGNYAYLAAGSALVIVNVSNRALPVEIYNFDLSESAMDVQVKSNYAYVAGDKGLHIIDVTDPSAPFRAAQWQPNVSDYFAGLFVSGSYVYLLGYNAMEIIDITNPAAPVSVGQSGPFAEPGDVYFSGNYAYVTSFWGDGPDKDTYLDIIDISAPASPVDVGFIFCCTGFGYPCEVVVSGNYAYIGVAENGLYIIDVSTPATPSHVKNYITPGEVNGLAVDGQHVFVADNYGGLQILDISTPANASLVGAFDHSTNINDVTVNGNYAYAAGSKDGLLIFNISSPSSPTLKGSLALRKQERVEKVFVSGSYAFMVRDPRLFDYNMYETFYIINIANPGSPSLAGTYQGFLDIVDVYVSGNYAYVLGESWDSQMHILDITNPSLVTVVGNYNCTNEPSAIWVSGNYVYITYPTGGVEIIDISTPSTPTLAGSTGSVANPRDISVMGNYAYVTGDGFSVLDISSPSTPALVGTYNYGTFGPFSRLHAQDKYVYLSNSSGLLVLDVSNPASPGLAASYNVSDTRGVYAVGNYVYLAGAEGGKLQVLYQEEITTMPQIHLSTNQLQFAADTLGAVSDPLVIYVDNSGIGTLEWQVTVSDNWIIGSPLSGINKGMVEVSVDTHGLTPGTYTGTVFFSSPNASISPREVQVTLTVYQGGQTSAPFGVFETPSQGATVFSSVPFTGWALDDVGVQKVQLFREVQNSLYFIGDAVLVAGARPDVELAYPGYPNNHKAGWGYMMLTNFLPNQGNGTFTIHAIATDMEGNQVTLGTRTIFADNINAVKPFGAIDTPAQGGMASGASFINFGWVLAPLPNTIPTDGSTIQVWVDGVSLGHPVYNSYRADIASLFPDNNNSNGAGGYFYLDTTQYDNGVHTIQWTASDNNGNTDGIGSRYFTISNTDSLQWAASQGVKTNPANPANLLKTTRDPGVVSLRKGFDEDAQYQLVYPDDDGVITIEIKEMERVELRLDMKVTAAYQVIGQRYGTLPWGSFLDREKNIFYWQPGYGFLGRYRLVFIESDTPGNHFRKDIEVVINSKF